MSDVSRRDLRALAWRCAPLVRVVGAALLLAMAWIHYELYDLGYASVPRIGTLFLVNVVLGVAAAVALLVTPSRWLPVVELGTGLLALGTLLGLVLSTTVGFLGFEESWDAPLVGRTVVGEGAGAVLLLGAALLHARAGRPWRVRRALAREEAPAARRTSGA